MVLHKAFIALMVLLLLQNVFTQPLDNTNNLFDSSEEEIRKNPTPAQKLFLFTFDNIVSLGQHFAANAANVSRYMLKDESMVANNKPEVVEFKKKLTAFIEQYETNKNPLLMWDILDMYSNATDYYYELPEDKLNPEATFVLGILNKYSCREIFVKFAQEFVVFMENFTKMFEENKAHLDKPMLDWYKKYSTLTDFEEKIDAFSRFIQLA